MSVGFSQAVSSANYSPRQKVKNDGIKAALIGGGVTGALSLAGQQYIKSNTNKIVAKSLEETFKSKPGFYTEVLKNYSDVIMTGKFNWKRCGKAALCGAAIFGLYKALKTAYKNLPADNKSLNYMA